MTIQTNKKTNKTIYFFIFLGSLLLISAILQVLTPKIPTSKENTWQEITPGITSVNAVKEKLGEPKDTTQYGAYSVLKYKSPYEMMPHEVAIDNNGLVIFIKEFLAYDKNHTINQYLESYKVANLELFAPMVSEAVKAYVFLDEGLVVIAHIQGAVEQKWYFVPTDEKTFLKSWEKELSQQQKGPEKFNL